MAAPASDHLTRAGRQGRWTLRALLLGALALFILAIALWTRYGSVVFMETMANAWAYCF